MALGVPGATATDDFHGIVARYGVGFGYDASPESTVRITPVVEFVGWTVTSGHATGTTDGTAATVTFEDANAIFVGYGEALTYYIRYERVLRAEYRLVFCRLARQGRRNSAGPVPLKHRAGSYRMLETGRLVA